MKKFAFAVTAASGAAAFIANHEAEASTQHTVQSGESLWTISEQYGVSVDEIKQNNNLDNNMVFPGQVIEIGGSGQSSSSNASSQTSGGSSHTVKSGESLNIIANNYGVSVDALMSANNLNGYLIQPGQSLKIPNGSSVGGSGGSGNTATQSPSTGNNSASDANLYDWGQCTWHVFNRRAQIGKGISTYWWNANNWDNAAARDGYRIDYHPTVGSIAQSDAGYYGHVAFVERVNSNGSLLVSEMNFSAGPGVLTYRTIPAYQVRQYKFIH